MAMLSRRDVLLAGTTGMLSITNGCLSSLQQSSPTGKLVGITLRNIDSKKHTLILQLFHENERIVNKKYELRAQTISNSKSGHVTAVKPTWKSQTEAFTAKVRLDGNEQWSTLHLNDDGVSGQYKYEIRITEDGEIEGWHKASDGSEK
ncbi:hypothetical protein [Halorussus pelagicus]|uniref:hypothetical protein n=1 Tax=Halorussus pelagicus TaxID=2505977 RepID=UPI000FFB51DC|nr:hypothetical protein [Halorussus pelagicus]